MISVEHMLAIAGIVSGGVALYIRLTLSDFIIKTLNGRYPTKEVFDAKLDALHHELRNLPCHLVGKCDQ